MLCIRLRKQDGISVRKSFAFFSRLPTNERSLGLANRHRKTPSTIQMAFAYTYIPSVYDEDRTAIRRRLRLQTVQMPVVKTGLELFVSAVPDSTICLLVHKA